MLTIILILDLFGVYTDDWKDSDDNSKKENTNGILQLLERLRQADIWKARYLHSDSIVKYCLTICK